MNVLSYISQNPVFIWLLFGTVTILFLIKGLGRIDFLSKKLTPLLGEIDRLPVEHPVRTKLVEFFSSKLYTYSGYEVISTSEVELKFTHINEEVIFLVSITRETYLREYSDFFNSLQLLLDSSDLVSIKD